MERKKIIPIAALGLAIAEITSACSYRDSQTDQEAKDLLSTGITSAFLVKHTEDTLINEGLNIRQYPGNVYSDEETNVNTIIGKVPAGMLIQNAVKINNKWAAADCSDAFNNPKSDKKGQICYFDYQDYTQEINNPQ